ncbi:T9SS type A sorting domain-containing protein [Flagellimonas sp. 2504JD4-2]
MKHSGLLYVFLLWTCFTFSQNCNCDVTLTGLSATSLNLVWASQTTYSPGDTICIPAGNYAGIRFYDFEGTASQPLIIKNCGGKVVLTESVYTGISFKKSKFIRLTGTGDSSHTYGIEIAGTGSHAAGVNVENFSTDIEIDHIEISSAGFAGIMAKTDPYCNDPDTWRANGFVLENLDIHHNYIHNTGGEGIYVGFTGGYKINSNRSCNGTKIFGHWLENVDIHHNIIENVDWDGIQLNLVRENGKIRDNYISNYGVDNVYYQDFAMSIGGGIFEVYNNTMINGSSGNGQGIQFISAESGTKIYNNVIVRPDFHGIFMHNRHEFDDTTEGYYILNNTIVEPGNSGTFYNTKITETNDPTKLYTSQDEVPSYFVNNLIVDPGNDYEGGNTWKQNHESYFDFNDRSARDSLLSNIYSNIMTRQMDTLGLTDILNDDYSPSSQTSDVVDAGSDVSSWGVSFDAENETRPSGTTFDIGAYEYQVSGGTPLRVRIPDEPELIDELPKKFKATVFYPNPTRSAFYLNNQEMKNPTIQIINLDGKVMYEGKYRMGTPFNVEGYRAGLYFIKVISEEKSETHRLIIR